MKFMFKFDTILAFNNDNDLNYDRLYLFIFGIKNYVKIQKHLHNLPFATLTCKTCKHSYCQS